MTAQRNFYFYRLMEFSVVLYLRIKLVSDCFLIMIEKPKTETYETGIVGTQEEYGGVK